MLTRILSAAVVLPFVLYAMHRGGEMFFYFVAAACGICLWEYATMALPGGDARNRVRFVLSGAVIFMAISRAPLLAAPVLGVLFPIIAFASLLGLPKGELSEGLELLARRRRCLCH